MRTIVSVPIKNPSWGPPEWTFVAMCETIIVKYQVYLMQVKVPSQQQRDQRLT
jgi:hypothetical protein